MRRFRGPRALGRTPLGRDAQRQQANQHPRFHQQHRTTPHLLRQDPRAPRGPQPPRPADDSFDWLLGNEKWKARVEARRAEGRDELSGKSGLEEIFEEISPIEDFSRTMSLSFRDRVLRAQVLRRGVQGAGHDLLRPAVRHGGVHEQHHRRDQEPDGLHGRLPADDRQGHLRHQRHRACRRLAAGPVARRLLRQAARQDVRQGHLLGCKVIPSRGAWLEFEIDKRDAVGVRIDRKRKQPVTVLLKALGWDDAKILERSATTSRCAATLEKDHTTGQDDALLDIYRKLRPGEPPTRESAQTLLDNLYFNPKRYDLAKVGRYKVNKKLGVDQPVGSGRAHRGRHRRDDRVHREAARRRDRDVRPVGPHVARRGRRHRPLRQPSPAHGRRADPEPGPHWAWPAWSASSASA